jgi:Tol biopolymer transport system component
VPGGETVGGPPATLVTVDRNGEGPSITEEYRPYRNPKTSPQGNRIAVEVIENTREGEIHIYVVDVESGVGNPLTTEGGVNIAPTWTADGNAVVFASDRSGSAGLDLYSRNADGTGQAEPVLSGDVDLIPVDVIPGTDVLLFEERGNPVKLRTLDLSEEGSDEDFVYGESNVGSAAASPDGRWVAYTEGTTGAGGFEVWVIPYPRATDTPRRVSDGPGSWPMWSPGGDEIYFTTFDTTGIAQLTSASVETSPAFSRRGIAPLFSLSGAFVFGAARRGYDVIGTVDGQRFLFVQPVGTADQTVEQVPRINIVLNWLEEVGERVPVP